MRFVLIIVCQCPASGHGEGQPGRPQDTWNTKRTAKLERQIKWKEWVDELVGGDPDQQFIVDKNENVRCAKCRKVVCYEGSAQQARQKHHSNCKAERCSRTQCAETSSGEAALQGFSIHVTLKYGSVSGHGAFFSQ